MTLEAVVKKALSDNADCLGGECDCVALGVAKAVRDFLLSDEVERIAAEAADPGPAHLYVGRSDEDVANLKRAVSIDRMAFVTKWRAALSSIAGDE